MDTAAASRATSRIEQIVPHFDERETTVRDCLADLMHWCDAEGMDFENELRIARDNYDTETAELEDEQ